MDIDWVSAALGHLTGLACKVISPIKSRNHFFQVSANTHAFSLIETTVTALNKGFANRVGAAWKTVHVTFTNKDLFISFLKLHHSHVNLIYGSLEGLKVLGNADYIGVHGL